MSWGVDGETGSIVDMKDYGIWEPYAVKAQVYKTAIEVMILLFSLTLIYTRHFVQVTPVLFRHLQYLLYIRK